MNNRNETTTNNNVEKQICVTPIYLRETDFNCISIITIVLNNVNGELSKYCYIIY